MKKRIDNYEEINGYAMDMFKEIGSIGTGNAATALSGTLSSKISMSLPEVDIMDYDQAIDFLGGPEKVIAAVLVHMTGQFSGIMLYLLDFDFMNFVLEKLNLKKINSYDDIDEMSKSAICEVSNIIISSYANAISQLSGISINLSVPAIALNMLGGIMSVPMIEYGYVTDKIMMVGGKLMYSNEEMTSNLLMLPDIKSLNFLFKKLGVFYE
ncbi:MAG: chemotaxis protein CheC [Clostridia bacterium]|jgi:chemotaxis protein CheC|nr:chemotaxis protein CheC [Clostridia bacterium]MCI1959312.1 chemotaxis protein CheC [Clostridia bacterium]MCI1999877.1 chemotaxis protein CheC [Clostridia bacterium]MCI2014207.1 chemotaxis protein CheC [Clostridia bacterium]